MAEAVQTLTPDLAERLRNLLDQVFENAEVFAPPAPAQFADVAHEHGVGLVDLSRSTFLVDTRVHEGVLFRLARLRRQQPPRLIVKPETWRGLTP